MTPQPQVITDTKPAVAKLPEQHRLVALVLFEASRFNHSDTITAKGAGLTLGQDTTIVPARISASGDWVATKDNERPDGFGLEQHRGTGKDRKLYRGFVLLGGVKELVFAE